MQLTTSAYKDEKKNYKAKAQKDDKSRYVHSLMYEHTDTWTNQNCIGNWKALSSIYNRIFTVQINPSFVGKLG